jgi:WD40 repeat protein
MTSTPDIKIKFRIDFGKDYLDRAYIDEDNEPDIMRVNFNDPSQKICTVKISKCFKIVATGLKSGKIKVYYLTEEVAVTDADAEDEFSFAPKKDLDKEDAVAMREEPVKAILALDTDNNF